MRRYFTKYQFSGLMLSVALPVGRKSGENVQPLLPRSRPDLV
jgi:hypothetical protein